MVREEVVQKLVDGGKRAAGTARFDEASVVSSK